MHVVSRSGLEPGAIARNAGSNADIVGLIHSSRIPTSRIAAPKAIAGDLDDIPEAALQPKQVVIPHEHRTIVQKGKWKPAPR
ncbi:MAG: hypothetical protein R2762_14380 [Bryobacteraceae bacterium]